MPLILEREYYEQIRKRLPLGQSGGYRGGSILQTVQYFGAMERAKLENWFFKAWVEIWIVARTWRASHAFLLTCKLLQLCYPIL